MTPMDYLKEHIPVRTAHKTVRFDIILYERVKAYCRLHGLHTWRVIHEALSAWMDSHDAIREDTDA